MAEVILVIVLTAAAVGMVVGLGMMAIAAIGALISG